MCQIHFIYNKQGIDNKDLDELTKLLCFGSLSKNRDAWGIFNNKKIIKKSGEFNPEFIDNSLINGKFLIGHNRLSTSDVGPILEIGKLFKREGKKDKEIQHHPFKIGDLTIVHNGIITNASSLFKKYDLKTQIRTDSYIIIHLIDYYLKLSNKENRRLKMIDAIQKTSKKIQGWYSVILYDKKDDTLYYFRSEYTYFHFNLSNDILIGSTEKINLDYIYTKEQKKHIIPKKNTIYIINDKDKLLENVGKLSPSRNGDNFKKELISEKPGELYKKINSLLRNPTKYEISEKLKLQIYVNNLQAKQLITHLTLKKIKHTYKEKIITLNLEDFYNGN